MRTDVLVLAAGTAGAVLTRRLLDAGVSVALVKAGGADTNPAIDDLSRVPELWFGPEDEALGIKAVADAPGVRKNLPHHFLVPVIFGTSNREVAPPQPFLPASCPFDQRGPHVFTH